MALLLSSPSVPPNFLLLSNPDPDPDNGTLVCPDRIPTDSVDRWSSR
ncbi:MAG: hypothetical protein U0974_00310 [Gemmatimonadales bacterium]|nr:hypothetical protein [Gemmatimonadales bacterium]MDZ4388162.1 hypothetical protein [Gemmatimonadales bacterium]